MKTFANRRDFLTSLAALSAGTLGVTPSYAQDAYPAKGPVRVIVPLPAGGAADATVRILTAALQTQMKQSFIVDNRPGGSFVIGMQAIAQAPADGYTLMHLNPGMCAVQAALKKIDLLKTLTPISIMGTMPSVLVVPASSPVKTVKELVASRAPRGSSVNYGSVGIGSLEHLWSSNFSKHQGMDAVHVPFKGMPDAATALASGEIQFLPLILAVALPFIQKGMMRPLAVLDTQRHAALPQVPTLRELGFDEPPLVFWGGLAAPRGTPAAIIEQLRENMATAIATPDVRTRLAGIGTTAMVSASPQAFETQLAQELAWMNDAVKNANLQLS